MANLGGFDANTVKPTSFTPLPAGWYNAIITESEMKATKDGRGSYLQLQLVITSEGEFKGRVVFERLNLHNANQQAVEIARGQLSAICRAVGVMTPQDSCELHNLPLMIRIACKKNDDTLEVNNIIKEYKAKGSVTVASAQATGADSATVPWAKH